MKTRSSGNLLLAPWLGLLCACVFQARGVVAQVIVIADGVTAEVTADGWIISGTIESENKDNSSTAVLSLACSFTLASDLTAFYGIMRMGDGHTVSWTSPTETAAKVDMAGPYTAATTLLKRNGVFSISGYNGDQQTVVLGDDAVIDLTHSDNTGPLTLAKSLYFTTYDANAGRIRFRPVTPDTTQGTPADNRVLHILSGAVSSSDSTSGQIHLDKHIAVDLSAVGTASITPGTTCFFTLMTGSTDFSATGVLAVTGNDDAIWGSISTFLNASSGHNLGVAALFDPLFKDDQDQYRGSWSSLLAAAGVGQTETLVKTWNLDASAEATKSLTLDLGNYDLVPTSTHYLAIGSGATLAVTSSGSGTLTGPLRFSHNSSTLAAHSSGVLAASFAVDAGSPAAGIVVIGDGTAAVAQALTPSQLNGKVSTILVKSSSTLTWSTSIPD